MFWVWLALILLFALGVELCKPMGTGTLNAEIKRASYYKRNSGNFT